MTDTAHGVTVTEGDQVDRRNRGGGYLYSLMTGEYAGTVGLPSQLPVGWAYQTDRILKETIFHESMWATAITKAITKQAALGFRTEDTKKDQARLRRSQQLFLLANGEGWVPFITKHLRDYLLTDNGAFVEEERTSGAPGSRLIRLRHLSSSRCWRTGDEQYPVLYTDIQGREHELRDYQVKMFCDMPRSDPITRGVGFCAAHRIYRTIYKLAAVDIYVTEKVAGLRALAMHFLTGISQKQLDSGIESAKAGRVAKGFTEYMGAILVALMGEQAASLLTVPLAEIPDGFDAKQIQDNGYIIYANTIGMPVQDIQPLTGQGLGTGTQTVILDEAAEGQGSLPAWRKHFEHVANEYWLPNATTFYFSSNDIRDKKQKADVESLQVTNLTALVAGLIINSNEARQLAADYGIIPEEFLQSDTSPDSLLTDQEKPADDGTSGGAAASPAPVATQAQAAQPTKPSPFRQKINALIQTRKEAEAIEQMTVQWQKDTEAKQAHLDGLLWAFKEQSVLDAFIARTKERFALLSGATPTEFIHKLSSALATTYPDAWEMGAQRLLRDEGDIRLVNEMIMTQRKYLLGFRDALNDGSLSPAQTAARVQMYAESVKAPYWRGAVPYAIPAVPGDGTTACLTNCLCTLRVVVLDGDGNVDIYWDRHADESCQGCIERAAEWAPLRIRDGEVQI